MSKVTPLGRPRDPAVDERVLDAALLVYGDVGWSGFSIEAVARSSEVGKASIYLRWSTKQDLLNAALLRSIAAVADRDTGHIRADLIGLTRQMLALYLGPSGRAAMRLSLDGERVAETRQWHAKIARARVTAARSIVRRAVERRELPATTSATLVLDVLCGGAMMHALSTPPALRGKVSRNADAYAYAYAEQLVSLVLD
jgi:AcrR family transcriptional regulator